MPAVPDASTTKDDGLWDAGLGGRGTYWWNRQGRSRHHETTPVARPPRWLWRGRNCLRDLVILLCLIDVPRIESGNFRWRLLAGFDTYSVSSCWLWWIQPLQDDLNQDVIGLEHVDIRCTWHVPLVQLGMGQKESKPTWCSSVSFCVLIIHG